MSQVRLQTTEMTMLHRRARAALALALSLTTVTHALAQGPAPAQPLSAAPSWAPAVAPKALSSTVQKGLAFLVRAQLPDGGWGQGEEVAQMRGSVGAQADVANVADTCAALLALVRAGSVPASGPHAAQVRRGLEFVLGQVERSDADSLAVTDVSGTRVQAKLGPYIDTFMASFVLAELKGHAGDAALERRLESALTKVLRKIEKHQRADGGFDNAGWAPVLAQAVAGKSVNRAAQKGAAVSEESRKRFEDYASRQRSTGGAGFSDEGSAGISLYAAAASVGTLSESANTRALEKADAEMKVAAPASMAAPALVKAKATIERADQVQSVRDEARGALVSQLDDPSFVAGFGSNGGEEFLSYMLVSESLVARGGQDWTRWDEAMTRNLDRVQNADGSFTGHHCITGRTFVTSTALLVLTADRAQLPVAAKIGRG
jgi:hypothetical protein